MGRYFTHINDFKNIIGTVASRFSCALSSYTPFQQINSLKKGKYYHCLERKRRAGRFFSHRPETSGIIREAT